MIKVAFDESFLKPFKKKIRKNPDLVLIFLESFQKFINNPFDKSIKTHKLSGRLKDLWAFSVDDDLRVIFSLMIIIRKLFLLILEHMMKFIKHCVLNLHVTNGSCFLINILLNLF